MFNITLYYKAMTFSTIISLKKKIIAYIFALPTFSLDFEYERSLLIAKPVTVLVPHNFVYLQKVWMVNSVSKILSFMKIRFQ